MISQRPGKRQRSAARLFDQRPVTHRRKDSSVSTKSSEPVDRSAHPRSFTFSGESVVIAMETARKSSRTCRNPRSRPASTSISGRSSPVASRLTWKSSAMDATITTGTDTMRSTVQCQPNAEDATTMRSIKVSCTVEDRFCNPSIITNLRAISPDRVPRHTAIAVTDASDIR
uniref:(northern house mosquito) hypothetical protein n=1 Tax=Culex pipiens TaxID=7175 RepID=A0A8D8HJ63_CULPI